MSKRWVLMGLGGVASGLMIAGVFYVNARAKDAPREFLAARASGALLAAGIQIVSDATLQNLAAIGEEDKKGNYLRAHDLVIAEIKATHAAREKALALLVDLQKMAASVNNIPSVQAQQLGLQAISSETLLVNHLLAYNEYLNQLLENLRLKFSSGNPRQYDAETDNLLNRMNGEARVINELNRKYQTLNAQFDKAL